jgi:hypothetical protein
MRRGQVIFRWCSAAEKCCGEGAKARARTRTGINHVLVFLSAIFAASASAHAQEDLRHRPASCSALATIQLNDCSVVNAFRCDDGVTPFFRYEGHDAFGLELINHMILSYGLIASSDGSDDFLILRAEGGEAELPLSDVFAKGSAAFSYPGEIVILGLSKPITAMGRHRALDGDVVISGHRFRQIRADIKMQLPPPAGTASGWYMIYVSEPLGLVFEGEGKLVFGGASEVLPSSPASVALPGQPGFVATVPEAGCGEFSALSGSNRRPARG